MPQAQNTSIRPVLMHLRARTRRGVSSTAYFAGMAPYRMHSSQSSSATPASWVYGVPAANAGGPSSATAANIPSRPFEATRSTPDNLTAEQRKLLEETIRVDHIGEAAANWIYQATKFVAEAKGDKNTAKQVEEMWATERHHLATLVRLQKQHRVRPTILYPLWKAMAMGLGAGTALMGKRAIMACTEAVETVIGEHYDDQIKALSAILPPSSSNTSSTRTESPNSTVSVTPDHTSSGVPADFTTTPLNASEVHPSLPLLHEILQEFRDDELEHLDVAVENEAQLTPGHALLSAIVGAGCRAAIGVAAKI